MEQERKYIRLYGYDYSKNGAYFVTVCTHERQKLFGNKVIIPSGWYMETDQMQYGEPDVETSESSVGATLHGCNSFPEGSNVSSVIDWFKTMTPNEYIRMVMEGILPRFNRRVWQRGYYDHVIRNRDDLLECRKYIKQNPVKALYEKDF